MGNNKSALEEDKRRSSADIKSQNGSSVNSVRFSSNKFHDKKIENTANYVNSPRDNVWSESSFFPTQHQQIPADTTNQYQPIPANTSRYQYPQIPSDMTNQYKPIPTNTSRYDGNRIFHSAASRETNENQLFSNNTRVKNMPHNINEHPEGPGFQKNTTQTINGNTVFPNSSTSHHQHQNEDQLFSNNKDSSSNRTKVENTPHNIKVSPEDPGFQKNTIQTMDTLILLELSGKESSYIVKQLQENKTIFENSIQGPISDSLLVIMMKIVRKICLADTYDKIELLKVVCCDNFLDVLGNYIINLPTHQRDCVKEDLLFLEESVLPFFEAILLLIPKLVCNKLRDLLIKTTLTVSGLEQYQNVKFDDAIKMKLRDMETSVKHHLNLSQSKVQETQDLPKQVNDEQKNVRSGPSQGNAQIKHLNFLTHNVFPNMIKKLDVPAHKVRGMRKNIYFVESEESNEGSIYEGEFLVALAQYLLRYYYKANNFLFLTTNELKMKSIDELKSKFTKLRDMKVGVIDSCEEFDATVIFISLGASESENIKQNIYEERQLCKALLGAKNGIYMIGNLGILEKQGPFWKEMKNVLQRHEAVSSALPLLCEVHQMVIPVACAEDFKKVYRSGCSRRCESKLPCGHLCRRLCHLDDREHKNYMCREPCLRNRVQCSRNHKCSKLCHETCEECTVSVIHNNMDVLCRELSTLNPTLNSAYSHGVSEKKKTMLPCTHYSFKEVMSTRQVDMWSIDLVNLCQEPCTATLHCGHVCTGTCGSCRQGRVHMPCRNRSKITLACGHRSLAVCSSIMGECNQKCFYECPHGKCKEKCGIPCTPCKETCTLGCEHSRCTKKCYELCDYQPCFESCKKLLSCGHSCIGICGEPCPPGPENCRVCNADRMKKKDSTGTARFVLLCNCSHVVRSNDLDRRAFSKQHQIESLACPICGFSITKTSRYLNRAKQLHRNLVTIRHVHSKYKENLTEAFWNIAKEIRSLSLPKEIEHHPKIDEIKMHFQVVKDNHSADHRAILLLMFLRNLLYPIVHGITGMVSPNHLDWFLYLLLERYEMGLCSQVVRELYREIVEYQKIRGKVYKQQILDLHRAIAFFTLMEKNTWVKCSKGHLSSFNSLLTECGTCDEEKRSGNK